MKNFFENLSELLPLRVKSIKSDGEDILIVGEGWKFNTDNPWRITSEGEVLFSPSIIGDGSGGMDIPISNIDKIAPQSALLKVDPVFYFSNGMILEVFSTDDSDSWILDIEGKKMYIGGL